LSEQNELKAHFRRRLHAVRDLLNSRGIAFALAVFPSHSAVTGSKEAEIVEWAASLGREAGIPTTNLLATLRSRLPNPGAGYLFPHDAHPTPLAYGLAAQSFAEDLSRLGVLQKACAERSLVTR
jgi:hypothetical protein